jgi:hypothetical protein
MVILYFPNFYISFINVYGVDRVYHLHCSKMYITFFMVPTCIEMFLVRYEFQLIFKYFKNFN